MTDTKAKRQRAPAGFYASIALIVAANLAVTVYFIQSMSGGMNMPGGWKMSMMWMRMPAQNWFSQFVMFQLMWLAMMVAMMLPSAAPMLLNFRHSLAERDGTRANLSTSLVACGYFAVWIVIGIAVYFAGIALADLTMRSPAVSAAVPLLSALTLVLTGSFQFSRWKLIGLNHCRDPFACSGSGAGSRRWPSFSHGLTQGIFCAICCSGLMLALLAVGVMNPVAMLLVALVIALEKLLPKPKPVVRLTGIIVAMAGLTMIAVKVL
jgi:predicted metal-binding membrane protein